MTSRTKAIAIAIEVPIKIHAIFCEENINYYNIIYCYKLYYTNIKIIFMNINNQKDIEYFFLLFRTNCLNSNKQKLYLNHYKHK